MTFCQALAVCMAGAPQVAPLLMTASPSALSLTSFRRLSCGCALVKRPRILTRASHYLRIIRYVSGALAKLDLRLTGWERKWSCLYFVCDVECSDQDNCSLLGRQWRTSFNEKQRSTYFSWWHKFWCLLYSSREYGKEHQFFSMRWYSVCSRIHNFQYLGGCHTSEPGLRSKCLMWRPVGR